MPKYLIAQEIEVEVEADNESEVLEKFLVVLPEKLASKDYHIGVGWRISAVQVADGNWQAL